MTAAKKITMDQAGRLVIPKAIRRAAGLLPGMPLEIQVRNGYVQIEPAPIPVDVVRRGSLLVAVPQQPVDEPVTTQMVEQVRAMTHDDRE